MATYDFQQQIYSLSQTANFSFNKRFSTLEALQSYITNGITNLLAEDAVVDLIGKWECIWGPYTYSHYADGDETSSKADPFYSDNTIFLAYNSLSNQYILSVAGTNGISWYGWLVEDFNTIKTVPWSKLVPDTPATEAAISEGTSIGIDILLNKITTQYSGSPVDLISFLKSHLSGAPAGATLAVTGHSLGGALSPTLALYLSDTQAQWDPEKKIAVLSTYPTAGPTPGNDAFAQHMENEMRNNYHASYNRIDMVPHAWQADMMAMIPTLFVKCGVDEPKLVADIVDLLIFLTRKNNYRQAQPDTVLNGTCYITNPQLIAEILEELSPSIVAELKKYGLASLNNLIAFFMEAAYQHTTAYDTLLNREAFARLLEKAVGTKPDYKHLVLEALQMLIKVLKQTENVREKK